ncbi:MAG TPA: CDP-alcohol phosphatidyltransferase family protein [Croceibacterium sp.]|nr:CDP-alcohol phosphatidyltransferase family protein [Croceibacterium sp.]
MTTTPAVEAPRRGQPAAGRVPELQDPLNRYVYHPLAARLARLLQPTGLSPNTVSVMSGLLICAAAAFYTRSDWAAAVWLGFACHLAWHVVDGADGDLARLTGRASAVGEFVDGACDYLGHGVLYVALAIVLDDAIGVWAWLLSTAAALSRVVQSNHAETQRRSFLWRVYGVPWLKTAESDGRPVFAGGGWFSRASERVARGYVALAGWLSPASAALDELLESAAGTRLADMRRRVRETAQRSIWLQKALGANPRTILLGASMLAGSPLWFLLTEAVALNVLLALSLAHHNKVERRLVAELGSTR